MSRSDSWRRSLACAWRVTWTSRALVWAAGVAGALALVRPPGWAGFDPDGLTAPFGAAGDAALAPAARWDAKWYLEIAAEGYAGEGARAAFFPLYPLLIRWLSAPAVALGADGAGARLVAGVAISLAAFVVAATVVHRLTCLELGGPRAALTVWLLAFFPTALYFSAVYSEALFLALSAACLYAGRQGRWAWAALLGALAAATRSTGAALVVPLAVFWWQMRRCSGPDVTRPGLGAVAWIAAVPLGTGAFSLYLALAGVDSLAPFTVGELWHRSFAGPFGGVWDGAVAAAQGVRQLASGSRSPVYFAAAGGDPYLVAVHNIANLLFLGLASAGVCGALVRLPAAYGAWALCALAPALSFPVGPEPLASVPRYMAVVFPLHMWLAAWALERRLGVPTLVAGAMALAALSALFGAWHWVG